MGEKTTVLNDFQTKSGWDHRYASSTTAIRYYSRHNYVKPSIYTSLNPCTQDLEGAKVAYPAYKKKKWAWNSRYQEDYRDTVTVDTRANLKIIYIKTQILFDALSLFLPDVCVSA